MTAEVCVLAIDVGICHMGLVRGRVSAEGELALEDFALVDVTKVVHDRVARADCTLPHTREIYDRLCHFEQEYGPEWIEPADAILIERQPLVGLQSVQDFFFGRYRERAHLVSPNAMHCFYKINHLDYENRKERTESIACHLFHTYGAADGRAWSDSRALVRRHDVADAACLLYFWVDRREEERKQDALRARFSRYRHAEPAAGAEGAGAEKGAELVVSALFRGEEVASS